MTAAGGSLRRGMTAPDPAPATVAADPRADPAVRRSRRLLVAGIVVFVASLALPAVEFGPGELSPEYLPGFLCVVFFPWTYLTNAFLIAAGFVWTAAVDLRKPAMRTVGRVLGVLALLAHGTTGVWLVAEGTTPSFGYWAWIAATALVASAFLALPRPAAAAPPTAASQSMLLQRVAHSIAWIGALGIALGGAVAGSAGDGRTVWLVAGLAAAAFQTLFVFASRTRSAALVWTGAAAAAAVELVLVVAEWNSSFGWGAVWLDVALRAAIHGGPVLCAVAFLLLLPRRGARPVEA